jgi:DNA repair protein RecN (Recombination protein N)
MDVTELTDKSCVQEIARLISGEKITKTSMAHAEQLLGRSDEAPGFLVRLRRSYRRRR